MTSQARLPWRPTRVFARRIALYWTSAGLIVGAMGGPVAGAAAVIAGTQGASISAIGPVALLAGQSASGAVAASSQTLAVSVAAPGEVDALGRTGEGWSSSVAQLQATSGVEVGQIAATNDAVLADDASLGHLGPPTALVFDRPDAGWVGTVDTYATLQGRGRGSGATFGAAVAISGDEAYLGSGHRVQTFSSPTGQWQGTAYPRALLQVPGRQPVMSVAAAGDAVVAQTTSLIAIFQQRDGSWQGVTQPVAVIDASGFGGFGAVAATDQAVVVAQSDAEHGKGQVLIIPRPRRGWSGKLKVRAVSFPDEDVLDPAPDLAASGNLATLEWTDLNGVNHECPCRTYLFGISLTAPHDLADPLVTQVDGSQGIAMSDNTGFIATSANIYGTELDVKTYAITRQSPLTSSMRDARPTRTPRRLKRDLRAHLSRP